MSSSQSSGGQGPPQSAPQGPPYMPQVATLGGVPNIDVDVPIAAVFLALFVISAALNMAIFQINRRRGHKFIFSVLLFGFSMARITTLVMRIVWATRPLNVSVAIAAQIFVAAGVLLLFVVNLIFAQRVLRAYQPWAWHPAVGWAFRALWVIIVGLLVMVITATVLTFFTLDATTRQSCRTIQLFASTFLAALAFLPIPLVALAVFLPWRHDTAFSLPDGATSRIDKFGTGRFRTKIGLLLFTSALLTLGAGFRVGVAFDPRPIFSPAWFHHRACFYVFNFVIELVVVYTYALVRFDRRFHIPDGSSAPGHYSSGLGHKSSRLGGDLHVNDESDVFGPDETARPTTSQRAQERQWEQRAREELEKEPEEV